MRKNMIRATMILFVLSLGLVPLSSSVQTQETQKESWQGRPFFKNVLDLTEEQETKLQELRKAHLEQLMATRDQMKSLRSELRELRKDPQSDLKKIDALIDSLAQHQATLQKNAIKHRREMEKIFTPEQLEKLKKIRNAMTRRQGIRRGGHFLQRMMMRSPGFRQWRQNRTWRGFRLHRPFQKRWDW